MRTFLGGEITYREIKVVTRNKYIFHSHNVQKCENVNLESVIQSEVKRKTNIYMECLYIQYIYDIYTIYSTKIVLMNPSTGKKWRRRPREWTCGHSWGWRGWRN